MRETARRRCPNTTPRAVREQMAFASSDEGQLGVAEALGFTPI
ncbi:MAG TPA: hypothetical protein VE953_06010 [Terriglobales bacterium]|nr:hypothetical protein [Terriglobales bacterium]